MRESERTVRRDRHDTLDWSQFSDLGFDGRESFVDSDLSFDSSTLAAIAKLPENKKEISAKLRKVDKALPDFPFDITPHESPSCLVDELFFQTWADVLVSSGWGREEFKESNWVLVQWKARPLQMRDGEVLNGDGRSEERWYLLEETVPSEYRQELLEGKVSPTRN